MIFDHVCLSCGHKFASDIVNRRCSLCLSDNVEISPKDHGRVEIPQMIRGGNGTHWEGCWKVHWDCLIEKLRAENEALLAAIESWQREVSGRDAEIAKLCKIITALIEAVDRSPYGEDGLHHHTCYAVESGKMHLWCIRCH